MMKFLYKKSNGSVVQGKGFDFPKNGHGFFWIHVTNPTQHEVKRLIEEFKLEGKIFDKFFTEKRSRRYFYNPLSFVLVDYYSENGKTKLEDILYVIGKDYMITVTKQPLKHYEDAFKIMRMKMHGFKNVGYLFAELLDYDSEENYDVLQLTEKRVSEVEKGVLDLTDVKRKITEIIEFKRELLMMWRRWWSSSKMIFSIKKGLTPIKVDDNLIMMLDNVHSSYIHQMEMVSNQREMLTDALTIYEAVLANRLATVSNNINQSVKRLTWVMYVLTGISTVLTVPNTIATIFGIPEWPLTGSSWQYIALLLTASLIIPTIWFYFHWKSFKKEAQSSHDFY
jgi:Mg2+ and Co2+ transporter CorA